MADAPDFNDPQTYAQLGAFLRSITPIDQLVRQAYPQMAWALNHPELGPILKQAAKEQWDTGRLQGALLGTAWYRNTDAAQRQWQQLLAEDPHTAFVKFIEAGVQVKTLAARLGVTLSPDALKALGNGMAAEGWDITRLTQEVMNYSTGIDPNNATGDIAAMTNQIKDRAGDYFMQLGDQAAFSWAKNIITGAASKDGLDAYLRQQAINRFSGDATVATALQNGSTLKEIFDPYVQQTASLLEVSPETIDLMDPKWAQMVDSVQADGTRRPMTLSEASTYIRNTGEWKATAQAEQASAGFAETILKTFGEVA